MRLCIAENEATNQFDMKDSVSFIALSLMRDHRGDLAPERPAAFPLLSISKVTDFSFLLAWPKDKN